MPKRAGDEKEVIQSQRETESEEGRQQRTRRSESVTEDTEGLQRRVWDGGRLASARVLERLIGG